MYYGDICLGRSEDYHEKYTKIGCVPAGIRTQQLRKPAQLNRTLGSN
jgi:hypothetical protein